MKLCFILATLFVLTSCGHLGAKREVASALTSNSCRDYTESAASFMTYTKTMNPKNVLYFSVRHDQDCKPVGEVFAYWVMDEQDGHCEALDSSEKKYFAPTKIQLLDNKTAFTLGVISLLNSKQSTVKISDQLIVSLSATQEGTCKAQVVSSIAEGGKTQSVMLENMHAKVKLLSIETVTLKGKKSDSSPYLKTLTLK